MTCFGKIYLRCFEFLLQLRSCESRGSPKDSSSGHCSAKFCSNPFNKLSVRLISDDNINILHIALMWSIHWYWRGTFMCQSWYLPLSEFICLPHITSFPLLIWLFFSSASIPVLSMPLLATQLQFFSWKSKLISSNPLLSSITPHPVLF